MSKRMIHLTQRELLSLIREATNGVLNEMDAKTYSLIHNSSKNAKEQNQSGNFSNISIVNNKSNGTRQFICRYNDDTIQRADSLEPKAQQNWLKDFIGHKFKFYAKNRMGLTAHVIFEFEKITKMDLKKTILIGTVTFNQTQISGDGIIVDFIKNKVQYHERGSRYYYDLEIDIRSKEVWDNLLVEVKTALDNRI